MQRPTPTYVVHFTRVEHVAGMVKHGLLSDNEARAQGLLQVEVGNNDIKERRRRRRIGLPPGGTVADYVPFYYAPRSPMMYAIHCDNVPTYKGGCDRIVYLVSTLERLAANGLDVLMTDRNAVLEFAEIKNFALGVPDDFIDWTLMTEKNWFNTYQFPDRRERRMAECLAHPRVPWDAIEQIATKSPTIRDELARDIEGTCNTPIIVRPQWYF